MPFSIEDKHTIKLLRQQKLYGATKILRMCPNKNWTLSGVKTVLSKIDATGRVEGCSGSGRPRTARSPDTISDMAAEQSDPNLIDFWSRSQWTVLMGYLTISTKCYTLSNTSHMTIFFLSRRQRTDALYV